MKAITIHQPWATLIALGEKKFETRSWATKYRGPIAIHAGKEINHDMVMLLGKDHPSIWHKISPLQTGCIVAIAELVDCPWVVVEYPTQSILFNGDTVEGNELMFGDFSQGRYAWELANVRQIEPIPAKGQQRIWNWEGRGNE